LGYVIVSDPLLRAATLTGIAVFGLALLLLLAIIALRVILASRQQREQRVVAHCRPLLLQALEREVPDIPEMRKSERIIVLHLWRQLHESLRGPALEKLNSIALRCGFDALARGLLASHNVRDQLLGIATAGLLRDRNTWDAVNRYVAFPNPVLSLAAARSLLLIDPAAGLTRLMPDFSARTDWPIAGLAAMLAEVGPDRTTGPLIEAAIRCARAADAAQSAPRVLRLLELTHLGEATATARFILERTTDDLTIAAALRLLREPQDLPLLRRCCMHPSWIVRVQAAHGLERLGAKEDRALLVKMIGDANWWVRYRAAQALAALPFVDGDELENLRQNTTDRFAADMLTQVIAERKIA
jgi:hypothetical protein